jgi:hypothetical protein
MILNNDLFEKKNPKYESILKQLKHLFQININNELFIKVFVLILKLISCHIVCPLFCFIEALNTGFEVLIY